jgi:hypothetical protein
VSKPRSPLQRGIHRALVAITAGAMRSYLDGYQTTIGQTVYVTADWEQRSATERYLTLRHERVHLRQFRRLTLPGMAFVYLALPLPLGLSWCRARLEWEAYAESMAAAAEVLGLAHVRAPAFRERVIGQFTGPAYGWMWPFRRRVDRWYDAELARLSRVFG